MLLSAMLAGFFQLEYIRVRNVSLQQVIGAGSMRQGRVVDWRSILCHRGTKHAMAARTDFKHSQKSNTSIRVGVDYDNNHNQSQSITCFCVIKVIFIFTVASQSSNHNHIHNHFNHPLSHLSYFLYHIYKSCLNSFMA